MAVVPSEATVGGTGSSDVLGDRLLGALVACFAAAAALRIIAVVTIDWHPWFDDAWYFEKGVGLAAGQGYAHKGQPTAYFPVGYPATLALLFNVVGSSFRAAQFVNVAFSLATMGVLYILVRQLTAKRGIALLATALFGFLPNQIASCCVTMSEITFTFAVTLGILLTLRKSWYRAELWGLVVGVAFGWATLIRPQAIFVPFLIVPMAAVRRSGLKLASRRLLCRLALVALGLAAVVGPWTYRNHAVFGEFVLVSTNGGENLLIGNNPIATQRYAPARTFFPPELDSDNMPELERNRLGAALAKEYILSHPLRTIASVPKKIWYMYRSDLGVTNWIWEAHGQARTPLYYVTQGLTEGCYLVVLLAAFAWIGRRLFVPPAEPDERVLLYVTCIVTAYFTLICAVFFGDARYHQPLMPVLSAAAALGATSLRAEWMKRRHATS